MNSYSKHVEDRLLEQSKKEKCILFAFINQVVQCYYFPLFQRVLRVYLAKMFIKKSPSRAKCTRATVSVPAHDDVWFVLSLFSWSKYAHYDVSGAVNFRLQVLCCNYVSGNNITWRRE